jgi:hypothetical protein
VSGNQAKKEQEKIDAFGYLVVGPNRRSCSAPRAIAFHDGSPTFEEDRNAFVLAMLRPGGADLTDGQLPAPFIGLRVRFRSVSSLSP